MTATTSHIRKRATSRYGLRRGTQMRVHIGPLAGLAGFIAAGSDRNRAQLRITEGVTLEIDGTCLRRHTDRRVAQ